LLVIRLRRLGDILRITPLLRELRAAVPHGQIDVMVSEGFEAALAANPHVDRILVVRSGLVSLVSQAWFCRRQRYDAVLDLQSSPRTIPYVVATRAARRIGWKKRWLRDLAYSKALPGWDDSLYFAANALRFGEALGLPASQDLHLDLTLSPQDRDWAASKFATAGLDHQRPRVAFSIVARDPGRRWDPAAFARLADRLVADSSIQLVLAHSPGEEKEVRTFATSLRTHPILLDATTISLAQLGAIYERCTLWVGNDGGPKHVATAVRCPTVTLVRRSDRDIAVDRDDPSQTAVVPPVDDASASLTAITVDQVYAAVRARLS